MRRFQSHPVLLLLGLILLVGLLGAASALAEEETGMNTSPDPVTFLKPKELQKVTIENVGTNELTKISVIAAAAADYRAVELCKNVNLKPKGQKGDTCVEEVECRTAKTTGTFVAKSAPPEAVASSELKC